MIVKELLDVLQKAKLTDKIILVKPCYAMGSSQTGMYECGVELCEIEKARVMKADTLAGLDELEKLDRVELTEEWFD